MPGAISPLQRFMPEVRTSEARTSFELTRCGGPHHPASMIRISIACCCTFGEESEAAEALSDSELDSEGDLLVTAPRPARSWRMAAPVERSRSPGPCGSGELGALWLSRCRRIRSLVGSPNPSSRRGPFRRKREHAEAQRVVTVPSCESSALGADCDLRTGCPRSLFSPLEGTG